MSVPRETIDTVSENGARIRIVGSVPVEDDTTIWIDHVFTLGTSPDDDPDEGYVGLTITGEDIAEADGHVAKSACLLTAEEALLLADRLQRAAHLVLETDEDLPDPEREYRRHRGNEDLPWSGPQPDPSA